MKIWGRYESQGGHANYFSRCKDRSVDIQTCIVVCILQKAVLALVEVFPPSSSMYAKMAISFTTWKTFNFTT